MLHQTFFDVKGGLLPFSAGAKAIADFPKPAIRQEMVEISQRMTGLRTNRKFARFKRNASFRPQPDFHPTLELPRGSVKSRRSPQM